MAEYLGKDRYSEYASVQAHLFMESCSSFYKISSKYYPVSGIISATLILLDAVPVIYANQYARSLLSTKL